MSLPQRRTRRISTAGQGCFSLRWGSGVVNRSFSRTWSAAARSGCVAASGTWNDGAVGRVHVTARLVKADALDRRALNEAEGWRPVESHVEWSNR